MGGEGGGGEGGRGFLAESGKGGGGSFLICGVRRHHLPRNSVVFSCCLRV